MPKGITLPDTLRRPIMDGLITRFSREGEDPAAPRRACDLAQEALYPDRAHSRSPGSVLYRTVSPEATDRRGVSAERLGRLLKMAGEEAIRACEMYADMEGEGAEIVRRACRHARKRIQEPRAVGPHPNTRPRVAIPA